MPASSYVAIVLAGRGSERLGGADKAMVEFEGGTLLDAVLDAVADADQIVVVGPERPSVRPVVWCEEKPSGGGPVAAFAAGLTAANASELVLLVASDLPFIGGAVTPLLGAVTPSSDAAVLVDGDGRANYLASAWRRSTAEDRLSSIGDPANASMRRLLDGVRITEVRDTDGWGFDCDTWEALDRARRRGASKSHE